MGKAQDTNFNGQIADTALALTTYTILSLGKRFSYETIGSLFRANKQDMLEQTISESIMEVILSLIIMQLLAFIAIDIDQTMHLIAGSDEECGKIAIMLNTVNHHSKQLLTKNYAA